MESFRPEDVVGKHYEHGMLPYGGGVSMKTGRVVFATSHEEHKRIMEYLRSLEWIPGFSSILAYFLKYMRMIEHITVLHIEKTKTTFSQPPWR